MIEIGRHVTWRRIRGLKISFSPSTNGFGSLYQLEKGKALRIEGDYGIITTPVKKIINRRNKIFVYTRNSVYELKHA